ncbi:MAG: FixH family protein [Gammaproteobacteria bacterium]|nr:FixH family protein [Gammaproteobacteria bacterium]
MTMIRTPIILLTTLVLLTGHLQQQACAHGGVVEEDDLCVIKVNYLRGHFKIFQPRRTGHEDYCEDLPSATETVFIMEYLHESLADAAVDFRIIHDVTGKGRFARWEDVAEIEDLQGATVFYREPSIDPDVLSVVHEFTEEGEYIGIVTANVDGEHQIYRAVFPFEVGFTGYGYWPLFIVLLLAIQVQYFIMSGRFAHWRDGRKPRDRNIRASSLLLVLTVPMMWSGKSSADAAGEWVSARGIYEVSFESSLVPIEINRIHSWTLHVTAQGQAVTDAVLSVVGGMPAHDHGLPTRPRVTEELGDGDYRLEGMRFHMRGDWEVAITIEADGKTDTVLVLLSL